MALQRRWIALGRHLVPSPALAVVLLAGLVPFFWVQSGYVAKAEDFILPMNLDQWAEFFSTWQTRVGFGSSPDDRLPAVFFLFWPALFRALGASIELAQRLQFVLWFSAMGLSMYVLMRHLTTSRIAWAGRHPSFRSSGPPFLPPESSWLSVPPLSTILPDATTCWKCPMVSGRRFLPICCSGSSEL